MKKIALAVTLAALIALLYGAFFLHQSRPDAAPASAAATPDSFSLRLSTRLSAVPEPRVTPGAAQATLDRLRTDDALVRSLLFLTGALALGAVGALALRGRAATVTGLPAPGLPDPGGDSESQTLLDARVALEKDLAETRSQLAARNEFVARLGAHGDDADALVREIDAAHEHARHAGELATELEALRAELIERDHTIARLHDEIQGWHAQLKDAQDTAATRDSDAQTLATELADARHHADQVGEQLDAARVRIEQAEAELADREVSVSRLDTELDDARGDARLLDEHLRETRDQVADRDSKLAASKEEVRQLDERLREMGAQIEDRDTGLAASAETARQLEDQLRETRDALMDRDEELRRHEDQLGEAREQVDARETALAARDEDLQAVNAQLAAARTQVTDLESRLAASEELAAGHAQRVDELAGVQQRLESWGSTVSTLENDLRARDRQVTALRDEIDTLNALAADGEQAAADLVAAQSLIDEQAQNRARLDAALTTSEADNDALRLRLAAEQEHSADLALRHDRQHARVQQLVQSLHALELDSGTQARELFAQIETGERSAETIVSLQEQLDDWQRRHAALEAARDELQAAGAAVQNDLDATIETGERLRVERAELTLQLAERSKTIEELDGRVDELTFALDVERQEVQTLNDQISGIIDAKTQLAEWDSTIQTFRSDIDSKSTLIGELQDNQHALQDERRALLEDNARIAILEHEVQEKTRLARALKEGADTLLAYKDRAIRLEEELAGLRDELASAGEQHGAARSDLATRQARIEQLQEELQTQRLQHEQALAAAAAGHDAALAQLDTQINTLETDYDALSAELQNERGAAETLRAQTGSQRTEIVELDSRREELARQLDAEKAQAGELREQLTDRDTQIATLSTLLDESADALGEAHAGAAARDSVLTEVQAVLAATAAGSSEIDRLVEAWPAGDSSEPGSQGDDGPDLQALPRELGADIAALRERLAGLDEMESRLDERETDIARERERSDALGTELERERSTVDELRRAVAQAEETAAELAQQRARAVALESELERERHAIADLTTQAEDAQSLRAELTELAARSQNKDAELDRERERVTSLGDELAQERSATKELRASLGERERMQVDLDAERSRAEALHDDLERQRLVAADLDARAKREDELTRELDELRDRNAQLCDDLEEQVAARSDAQSALAHAHEERDELQRLVAGARADNDALTSSLEDERRMGDEIDRTVGIDPADTSGDVRLSALRELAEKSRRLDARMQGLDEEIARRERIIDDMLAQIADLTGERVERTNWRSELSALTRSLASKDKHIDELAKSNVALRQRIENDTSETGRALQSLRAQLAANEALVEQMEEDMVRRDDEDRLRQELDEQRHQNAELSARLARRDKALARLTGPDADTAVPVLRSALHEAPPVLTASVDSEDGNES